MKFISIFWIFMATVSCAVANEPVMDFQQKLDEAFQDYQQGERAKTNPAKQEAFNQALARYLEIEPLVQNGALYYDIGNCYFQLGQYPLAIFYYYRAQRLLPREAKIHHNLIIAQEKLGLPLEPENTVFKKLFAFHYQISEEEQLQTFFFLSTALIFFASLRVWFHRNFFLRAALGFGIGAILLFCSLIATRYFSNVEAVVIRSTVLYRDAGMEYARVREAPEISGSKVNVIEILKEGEWLKILTNDGIIGYVPQQNVRIVEGIANKN